MGDGERDLSSKKHGRDKRKGPWEEVLKESRAEKDVTYPKKGLVVVIQK